MTKRIIALVLLLCLCSSLFACGKGNYPAVESTKEESEVIIRLQADGKRYDVKYELYRALFLSYHTHIDGGDLSVWQGADKASYIEKIDKMIIDAATDIYATLHHADKIGINPYSKAVEDKIQEYIRGSVDGYDDGEMSAIGYGGDYEAYLNALKQKGLNYSTQVLIYRYAIVYDKIVEHYAGTANSDNPTPDMSDGALKYTKEDVEAYYNGTSTSHVLLTTLDSRSFTKKRAEEIRNKLASYNSKDDVISYIMNFTATTESDATRGVLIGEYSLDRAYFGKVTSEALRISVGEVSEVVPVSTERGSYYYILYRVGKSPDYLNDYFGEVQTSYVNNEIGKLIAEDKDNLKGNVSYTDAHTNLDRSQIKIPE